MVSHEHDGTLVTTAATVRRYAALPVVGRWCWWLKDVELMAKQLRPR